MITCAEAVHQLWAYVEDELTASDRERITEHLDVCRKCCGEVEFAGELRKFLGTGAEIRLPADVRTRMESFLDGLGGAP
jgi:anti-sigma factor (TIGR02949 family)